MFCIKFKICNRICIVYGCKILLVKYKMEKRRIYNFRVVIFFDGREKGGRLENVYEGF